MFKLGLSAVRPNDHFILNKEPHVYVNGEITQYLLNHQLNGVRFLYTNYRKTSASILNDESGSGKCFQCIAFFDAILRLSDTFRILIMCQHQSSIEHWQFHIDCFLNDVHANVADSEHNSQNDSSSNAITIASIDYVLNHLTLFTTQTFECVVFQDQQIETSMYSLQRLSDIKATYKISLCSNDLMNDLPYFYELLKFCGQLGPIRQSKNVNCTLSLDEFESKFGFKHDKMIPKRNQILRQRTLLNACSEFYMRRLCNQLGSQFPPIASEDFRTNFEEWKTFNCDTVPLESNQSIENDSSSPIELLPAPNNRSFNTSNNDELSILNVACTDFSEFDTQMSPLIYSDSDESAHNDDDQGPNKDRERDHNQINKDDNNDKRPSTKISENINDDDDDANKIIDSSQSANSKRLTPEIVCNQEHAAKNVDRIASIMRATTSTNRTQRIQHDNRSPISKRLNYKQLPIEIVKKPVRNVTGIVDSESQSIIKSPKNHRPRSTSSTSDIQIISQKSECVSPIIISTSSSDHTEAPKELKQMASETCCPSPDLFASFLSTKSVALSQPQNPPADNKTSPNEADKMVHNVFGAPDECDDIDLLSNTNVDIFEITKNSVFDNILCSANDRITPLKSDAVSAKATVSCLSGLRVVLPGSSSNQAQDIQNNDLTSRAAMQMQSSQGSSDDVIVDLTLNETQKVIEISSEDSARDIEKTPERKRELTPSTRSCLKRSSNDRSTIDEKRSKTPQSRLGWFTKARKSPKSETPQSRRRLDKWKHRIDDNQMDLDGNRKVTRPRNLFNEFKSNARRSEPSGQCKPSTSKAVSPNIFSDNE